MDEQAMVTGAAHRVNSVIQKMSEPPETVLQHLKRIGIEPVIDLMQLDGEEPKSYVLLSLEELLLKELENLSSGGHFRNDYPAEKKFTPVPTSTEPIVLDEIRKRMDLAKKRHPSNQMTIDDLTDDDEWPIIGESPSL